MNRWVGFAVVVLVMAAVVFLLKVEPSSGGVEHFRQQLLG